MNGTRHDRLFIWAIDIEAANPQEAAEKAREYQIDPDTTATVFEVFANTGYDRMPSERIGTVDVQDPGIFLCECRLCEERPTSMTARSNARTSEATAGA